MIAENLEIGESERKIVSNRGSERVFAESREKESRSQDHYSSFISFRIREISIPTLEGIRNYLPD